MNMWDKREDVPLLQVAISRSQPLPSLCNGYVQKRVFFKMMNNGRRDWLSHTQEKKLKKNTRKKMKKDQG
jgi:hypothetical protein